MRFFRNPQDLSAWVKTHGAKKAAAILVNLPKVGEKHLADVVETTKRIVEASDANAADVLYAILGQAEIVGTEINKVEEGIEQVRAANDLLTHKIIAKDEHSAMVKQAQIMRQPGQYDMPLRICPKLPWSVGKKLISTYNCRHYCLDGVVLDDDPTRVYCGELLWRRHVADKFSSDYQDRKTGELVGGYINERFFKFPDAGTPGNPDVARNGGNPMMLKPGERTRVPRPHQWSVERRMQEAREKGSTSDHVLGKTASVKTAYGQQFINTPEDMDWLWDTHLKQFATMRLDYRSAMIYGNEDSPVKIELFKNQEPNFKSSPVVFILQEDGTYKMEGPQKESGWVGRMIQAQVDVSDVNEGSTASGTITKTLPGGIEVELEWTASLFGPDFHKADEVYFAWPQNMQMNATPGNWNGDVCKPDTNELLIAATDRETMESTWSEEVLVALDDPYVNRQLSASTMHNKTKTVVAADLGQIQSEELPDTLEWDELSQSDMATPTENRRGDIGEKGLCPVCGTPCNIIGKTRDGRLIGRCSGGSVTEAFTIDQWQQNDDGTPLGKVEAKKKGKAVNPWAVCHTTVDKDKNPEKYEHCVLDVKKDHPVKASQMDNATARKVIMAAGRDNLVKISSKVIEATSGDDEILKAFSMAIDLKNEGLNDEDAAIKVADATGMSIAKAVGIQSIALKKMAAHVSEVYTMESDKDKPGPATKSDDEVQADAAEIGLLDTEADSL